MDRFQVNHQSAVPAQDYNNSSNQGAQLPTHSNLDRWNQTPNHGNVISRSGSSDGDRQPMGNSGLGSNSWISTDNRWNTYPSGTIGGGTGYNNGGSDGSHQAVGNNGLGSNTWIDYSSGTNGGYGYGNQQSYTDHQSRYNSHHQGTRSASYSPYGSAHEDTRQQMRCPPQHPMQSSSGVAPQQQNPVVSGHRGNIPIFGGPDPYATTTGSDPYLSNRMNSTTNGSGLDRSWQGQAATGSQFNNHWQTSNFNPAVGSYPQPYSAPFQTDQSQFHDPSIQLPSSTSTNDYIGHLSSQQPLPTRPPYHKIPPANSHGYPGQPQGQPCQVFPQQQSTSIVQSPSFSGQHGSNPGRQPHAYNTAISGSQLTGQAGADLTSSGQINPIGQQPRSSSSPTTLSTSARPSRSSDVPPSRDSHANEEPEQRGRTYPCETCHRVFKYRTSLANHRRIHLDLRPYKCDVCGKAFRDQSTFNKHSRIHTGVKPYVCPVCNAGFSQSGNLRRHTSSKHADTE